VAEHGDNDGARARRLALELIDDAGERMRHARGLAQFDQAGQWTGATLRPLPARGARRRSALPMRIGIDQAAPAAAIERLPRAFLLREAVGHRIDRGGVMPHAAMTALDLDALGLGTRFLHAALPGADAVSAAENRGGRHRWWSGEV